MRYFVPVYEVTVAQPASIPFPVEQVIPGLQGFLCYRHLAPVYDLASQPLIVEELPRRRDQDAAGAQQPGGLAQDLRRGPRAYDGAPPVMPPRSSARPSLPTGRKAAARA